MNYRHQSRQQDLEEKKLLFEQFKEGLITREEHKAQVAAIDERASSASISVTATSKDVIDISISDSEGSASDSD